MLPILMDYVHIAILLYVVFSHGFESKKDAYEKMASEVIYHDQNVTTLVVDWSVGGWVDASVGGLCPNHRGCLGVVWGAFGIFLGRWFIMF